MIEVEGLSKIYRVADKQPGLAGTLGHLFRRRYRNIVAVHDVSFRVEPGEMVGFLGANGAGKTTLLKMLCGLIHPSAGWARVAGHKPQCRHRDFLQRITLVMGQKQQLIWDLPPLDSLYVNAAVYGINDHVAKRRIDDLADLLELGEELTRPMRKLSLGQRMKAELLAALLHKPEVLFLDEPTLGLDVNAQARIRQFLSEYNRRTGATVLLTSHYMADITALCPRVLMIHQGCLFHDGPLDQLILALSPDREVRLELESPVSADAFAGLGLVESLQGAVVHLRVPRTQLTTVVAALLERLPVLDLEVHDPPIETLIGKLFRQGKL
ncbi:ATP-binding cassette domain-containing protein [Synechococcus sp. M16CYN]|uniref:ABC transporter ATP-binding protein n=1 Tax=Synechococcus sp. M16CYN TaxID=3103139 RepID=UPI003249C0A0